MRMIFFAAVFALVFVISFLGSSPVQAQDAFALGMEAQRHILNKEYEQAVPLLVEALKQDPMNTWLRGMLANAYYQLKRFSQAKSQFEAISKMEPENDLASFMVSVLEPLAGLDDDLFHGKERPGKVELKPYEIEQRYGNAVIFILVADKDKKVFKTGSGFLIDENGLAVTNFHVVADGKYIVARLPNKQEYNAEYVVSYDVKKDLAVVKLDAPKGLPIVNMGDSSRVILGEQAVAIGSPQGLEHTISDGLVSAWRDLGEGMKFIQISVPISQGSSGGPLFNMSGEVIGVTSAGLKTGQNLNFAIPINLVKEILQYQARISLAELPGEKGTGQDKPDQAKATDAELIRSEDGKVVCVSQKLGFSFSLTDDAWNMTENISDGKYQLVCIAPNIQVHLNIDTAKQALTEAELVSSFKNHLAQNGFMMYRDFAPMQLHGNTVFQGIFDKEVEDEQTKQKVRSSMLLMLKGERVYFLSMWYITEDEQKLIGALQTIQDSFKVGSI
jgi:S1-C subfamily serine protease